MQKELLILIGIFLIAIIFTVIMLRPKEAVDKELIKYWKDAEFKDTTFKNYKKYEHQERSKKVISKYYNLAYYQAKGLVDENSYKEQMDEINQELDEIEQEDVHKNKFSMHRRGKFKGRNREKWRKLL